MRDLLLIFQEMTALRSYDVKSNSVLMRTLDMRVAAIKETEWRSVCPRMLRSIRGE